MNILMLGPWLPTTRRPLANERLHQFARHLAKDHRLTLACATDHPNPIGAVTALREQFDDLEFAARLDPPLTTIRQGVHAQGTEAAHALFELLRDPNAGPRRVILPTELVIRRSTIGGVHTR